MSANPWFDEPAVAPAAKVAPKRKPVAAVRAPVVSTPSSANPWFDEPNSKPVVPRGTVDSIGGPLTGEIADFKPPAPPEKLAEAAAGRQAWGRKEVQAVATPLEKTMGALTAVSRGASNLADEALSGKADLGSFMRGVRDPGANPTRTIRRHTKDAPVELSIPGDPMTGHFPTSPSDRVTLQTTRHDLAAIPGTMLEAADPVMWTGVGGVTKAGRLLRAAQIEHDAAKMMLAGVTSVSEGRAAAGRVQAAQMQLKLAEQATAREGTLASRGRAALSVAGRTNPVLAQERVMATSQSILGKVGRTRLARGVSQVFQPPEMRVDPAIRGRSFKALAAGDVGHREALRGIDDLTKEYPDVLKAVGGDNDAFEDALSQAHERSQARRFDVATDWMSTADRDRYWGTDSPDVKLKLEKDAQQTARASLPQYLNKAERVELRTAERSLAMATRNPEAAQAMVGLVSKAQNRAHLQAIQNSIHSARRMYFRGADPQVSKQFGDYAGKVINTVNARNASMVSNTVREGVQLNELADAQAYMHHAMTPEFQKSILDYARETGLAPKGMGAREFTEKHGPQMMRKLRMTAVEANQLAAAGKLSVNGGKPVKRAFYTNPLIAQTFREAKGAQAIGNARFIREVSGVYGKPVGKAPKGWRTVPNNIEGIGDQVAFEPEVADLLSKHFEALNDPGRIAETWDRMHQIWKSYTLGIFPVYHARNEFSDFWNAVVLGGLDPQWISHAMDELVTGTKLAKKAEGKEIVFPDGRRFARGALRDEAEDYGNLKAAQLRQEAIPNNIVGLLADPTSGGFPGAPAFKRISKAVREAGIGETGGRRFGSKVGAGLHAAQRQLTDNRLIEGALAVGDLREQALRLALYIDRRSRGWGPEAASLWVRKHMVDYGQLSETEKGPIRRVLPFYTWTRHNAPLQLEYLFAKPGAFETVQKVRERAGGDEGLGMQETPLPQFLEEGLPIRTGTSKRGDPEFWRLEGTWPGADAMTPLSPALDPGGAARKLTSMVTPFIREPAEQVTNFDTWRSKPGKPVPIYDYPGQTESFLGVPMDKRQIHALRNFRPLSEMDRLNPGDIFGTSERPAFGGAGEVRAYPDLDPDQRWMNLLIGRGYAVDPAKNASDWDRAVKRRLSTLKNEIRYAEAQGKTAKAEAARRQYEYILEHPESISPDMAK